VVLGGADRQPACFLPRRRVQPGHAGPVGQPAAAGPVFEAEADAFFHAGDDVPARIQDRGDQLVAGKITVEADDQAGEQWSTPGLVETRFSPDVLVWVVVVFHGTAAWRNHGLIIFPLLFYRTSVQLRCPAARLVGGLRPPGPPMGALGISSSGTRLCAAGSPGRSRVTRSVIACDAAGAL